MAKPHLKTGDVGPADAAANLATLEGSYAAADPGDVIELPTGELQLSAGWLMRQKAGPVRVAGNGTTLHNRYAPGQSAAALVGGGQSYADGFTRNADGTLTVAAAPQLYHAGDSCYSYLFEGYQSPAGQRCRRHRVLTVSGTTVKLDTPPAEGANVLKWVDGPWCDVAVKGAVRVRVADAGRVVQGMTVYVTSGPTLANESYGEYRRVLAVEGNSVVLDEPLSRDWPDAVLALGPFAEGVEFQGVTFRQSPGGSYPFFGKFCRGVRFVECLFGDPSDVSAASGFATCGQLEFNGCGGAGLQLNTCADYVVVGRGSQPWGTLVAEEGCFNGRYVGLKVVAAPQGYPGRPWINCFQAALGCDRLTVRDVGLVGAGQYLPGYGLGSAVAGDFTDCLFEGVGVWGVQGDGALWCVGGRNTFRSVVSEHRLAVGGRGNIVDGCRLPGVLFLSESGGDCVAVTAADPNQTYPAGWAWTGGSPATPAAFKAPAAQRRFALHPMVRGRP